LEGNKKNKKKKDSHAKPWIEENPALGTKKNRAEEQWCVGFGRSKKKKRWGREKSHTMKNRGKRWVPKIKRCKRKKAASRDE